MKVRSSWVSNSSSSSFMVTNISGFKKSVSKFCKELYPVLCEYYHSMDVNDSCWLAANEDEIKNSMRYIVRDKWGYNPGRRYFKNKPVEIEVYDDCGPASVLLDMLIGANNNKAITTENFEIKFLESHH